jgi:hypothetical protein
MTSRAIRLPNGNLLIITASQDGATAAEIPVEIGPEHPEYARWLTVAEPAQGPAFFEDRRTWIPREEDLTPEGWRS